MTQRLNNNSFTMKHVIDMFVFRDKTVRINIDFLDAFSNIEESKQCHGKVPFLCILQHLFPGLPSPILCAAVLPLIYAVWIENTLKAITSKLGFAWLQSPCCFLCCRLAIFPNFFLQRPKKGVFRRKGTRRRTGKKQRIFLF